MGVKKPTPEERDKVVLDNRIFQLYQTGATPSFVSKELSVSWSYVNDLFYAWDASKIQAKKTIQAYESPFTITFDKPANSDFILDCGDNR